MKPGTTRARINSVTTAYENLFFTTESLSGFFLANELTRTREPGSTAGVSMSILTDAARPGKVAQARVRYFSSEVQASTQPTTNKANKTVATPHEFCS